MKFYAYIRKSSEDKKRQIQSIPRQYEWCKKIAKRRGIKISKYFEDSHSGYKLNRPSFQDMINEIEKSNEPVGIITWKISRLARNPIDEGVIKYAFMRKKIGHIIARDREYRENESQIIMGVDFGQATQYSIELAKDVKEGMDKKIKKGYRPTKAPYGYINDLYTEKGNKKIFIDKKYFKPIQRILKLFSTGSYSVPQLQTLLTSKGVLNRKGRPFPLSTLYAILENRFYCGQFLWGGEIHKGKHKPMITLEEYEKIQSLRAKDQFVAETKYQNHFSGIISCVECGSKITGYSKIKNNARKGRTVYHYLKCVKPRSVTCTQKPTTRNKVDSQIIKILENLVIPKPVSEFMVEVVKKELQDKQNHKSSRTAILKKKRSELKLEIETLTRKLIKGLLQDDLFLSMKNQIQKDIKHIEDQLSKYEIKEEDLLEKLHQFIRFTELAPEAYKNGSLDSKKLILRTIGSNFLYNNGNVSLTLSPCFEIAQNSSQGFNRKNRRIEPLKNRSTTGVKAVFGVSFNVWSDELIKFENYFMDLKDMIDCIELD